MNQSLYSYGYNPSRQAGRTQAIILLLGGLAVAAFVIIFSFSAIILGWAIEAFRLIL